MIANKVFLHSDNILEVHVIGDQNTRTIGEMGKEIEARLAEQRRRELPCLILDNLTEIGAVGQAGRNKVVELAKLLDYDKVAMLGKGGLIRLGANLMLRAVGKGGKVKYFDDRNKAIAWLKS